MILKYGGSGGGVSASGKPNIAFDGKWSGWHVEFYDGKPYWEALFASSGTLTNYGGACTCDAWGIGGGGAGGVYYQSGYTYGNGGGSGYTNMAEGLTIPQNSTTAIAIGAGATSYTTSGNTDHIGLSGGATTFLTLSAGGGAGGYKGSAAGGSNGSTGYRAAGGENGTPGAGKIMSKFWSAEHNNEYGAAGIAGGNDSWDYNGGGGGGYMHIGSPNSIAGGGYGGGGGGSRDAGYSGEWAGKSGCLIIRIAA